MSTMTQLFKEARELSQRDRARLISKLIALDPAPNMVTSDELERRVEEIKSGHAVEDDVRDVVQAVRALAGIGGNPPPFSGRSG